MIKPEERFYAVSGYLLNGGPHTWHIIDFDQRRQFSVTYAPPVPEEDPEVTEELCMRRLRQHVDELGPGIYGMKFIEPDGPITTSTDLLLDETAYVNYHPLSALKVPFAVKTIHMDALTELDRFGPQVDLVSYQTAPDTGPVGEVKAAFKYWFMPNGMFRSWYELNSWIRLPRNHPHIVPFDAVVLNNVTEGIVGFTTLYVPGGNVKDNDARTRPFRLEWFRQLLSVVSDLNYRYGMMHQDIAPRNLLIDEEENLRIFDFNYSIMIGEHYTPERDDIKGVIFTLYEIITLDEHHREVPHAEQDAEALLQKEWARHPDVKLDSDVGSFRQALDEWVAERKGKEFAPADTWVRWPWMPDHPLEEVVTRNIEGEVIKREMRPVHALWRRHLIEEGRSYWDWQRPAGHLLEQADQKGGRREGKIAVPDKVERKDGDAK